MSKKGEVLVAIINNKLDYATLFEKQWYRIPKSSVDKWLSGRWPPSQIAFYQTKKLGYDPYRINFYSNVKKINLVKRGDLFPDEPRDRKSDLLYYQILIDPPTKLDFPIISRRFRRIIFIPTTKTKFYSSVEINDLYNESPLEDKLWKLLKRLDIPAERQEYVVARNNEYLLDFAIYCSLGKIDIETDGDTFHSKRENIDADNIRENDIKTAGWRVLRFNGKQIKETISTYCIPIVVENINKLGGIDTTDVLPKRISLENTEIQPSLFENKKP